MNDLDTLSVRFEADANALFHTLDDLDTRLNALKRGGNIAVSLSHEIETLLTVTADGAIARSLENAGDTLAKAVRDHDLAFESALAQAENAMAGALQAAVNKLAASINVTIPVSVDGYRLGTAAVKGLKRQSLAKGKMVSL